MRRILGVFLLISLAFPFGLGAQDHSEQIEFLNQLVGSFEYNPDGEGECQKVGEYTVNCISAWTSAAGVEREAIWITRFDPETERFMGYRFYENGYADSGPGWIDGNTSTFVYELPNGNRSRITATQSGDTTTYVWHRSVQGGPWEKTSEGSSKRVG